MSRTRPAVAAAAIALNSGLVHAGPLVTEDAILDPADSTASWAGGAVALEGSTIVLGAYRDTQLGSGAGAAFLWPDGLASGPIKLLAPDGGPGDLFGISVAMHAGRVLVGAGSDAPGSTRPGFAALFDATDGSFIRSFRAAETTVGDQFGDRVAMNDRWMLVTARGDDIVRGSAYASDAVTGAEVWKLVAEERGILDDFGCSVAVSGDTAIVGARYDSLQNDRFGAAYVFDLTSGARLARLRSPNPQYDAQFGWSVAIDGELAVVAAPREYTGDDRLGAAYIFDLRAGTVLHRLVGTDTASGDGFGSSVAIENGLVLVGASAHRVGQFRGAAYLFDAATGRQLAKLGATTPAINGSFGAAIDIDEGRAVIGDPRASTLGPLLLTGLGYLFTLPCSPADLADPVGSLTFADITAFLTAFANQDPAADLAEPVGQFTFADISAFLAAFSAGCP